MIRLAAKKACYFNYHAVLTNLIRLDGFRSEVCRAWRPALLLRSQRHRWCWDRFNRSIGSPLASCRIRPSCTITRSGGFMRHHHRQERKTRMR